MCHPLWRALLESSSSTWRPSGCTLPSRSSVRRKTPTRSSIRRWSHSARQRSNAALRRPSSHCDSRYSTPSKASLSGPGTAERGPSRAKPTCATSPESCCTSLRCGRANLPVPGARTNSTKRWKRYSASRRTAPDLGASALPECVDSCLQLRHAGLGHGWPTHAATKFRVDDRVRFTSPLRPRPHQGVQQAALLLQVAIQRRRLIVRLAAFIRSSPAVAHPAGLAGLTGTQQLLHLFWFEQPRNSDEVELLEAADIRGEAELAPVVQHAVEVRIRCQRLEIEQVGVGRR